MQHAHIKLVEGKVAPKHFDCKDELILEEVIITEQGTEANLPLVDFVMKAPNGDKFLLVMTGRILNGISAAIKGVNMRNHGVNEP